MEYHSQIFPAAIRGRYDDGGGIIQRLELRRDDFTNTLTGVQKDNVLVSFCELDDTERGSMESIAKRTGFRVRKLTQRECWRLMGFFDDQFDRARNAMNDKIYHGKDKCGSQLYKQAGNSIVVDVLEQIMANLYDAMPYLFEDMTVGSFFSGIGAFEAALTRLDPTNGRKMTGELADVAELRQIGYINNYNGDANRIYDSSGISRALKAEAGGGGCEDRMVQCPAKGVMAY